MATRTEIDKSIPISTTSFTGKSRGGYEIETYKSGIEVCFVRKIDNNGYLTIPGCAGLVKVVRDLYIAVYPERARRNPDLTITRMMRSLSYPRTVLELVKYQGIPVGYGIFPRLDIDGEPVLYSSRALIAEHEREGLGTHILERAISFHRRATVIGHKQLLEGMLMTQNWQSIRSLEHLQERGIVDKIQPIGEPFNEQGKRMLYGVHSRVFISSAAIEETGLSIGELREVGVNETVSPPQEGTRAWEIYETMVNRPPRGLGLNPYAGDVVYVRFTFPRSAAAAIVPTLAA